MKFTAAILTACFCIALVNAIPVNNGFQSQALDRLMVDETVNDSALRSKRTIGILRQLFPDISKMIEDKVNRIVGEVIKIFGPVVLQSVLGGNKNGGGGGLFGGGGSPGGGNKSPGSTVNVDSPFGDDDDATSFVDDDDWFNSPKQDDSASKISLGLPTSKSVEESKTTASTQIDEAKASSVSDEAKTETSLKSDDEATTLADDTATNSDVNPEASETNRVVREADQLASQNDVRVQFADEVPSQSSDTSEGELPPLDDTDANDDENRNKRFLNFGFGASSGNGNGGGSGGGSGNFLFDIIRQAADSAARAAGTVYRVVAGTQSLGLGLSASRDIGPAPNPDGSLPAAATQPQDQLIPGAMPAAGTNGTAMMPPLVAGSGSSASDPAAGAPTPGPQTEAVPGPVTRLFVIANRGISNLIQDLILRLAATSERIVNFKARLITSII